MEPIIIEELARMLEDQGAERGRREGEAQGRREGEAQGRREGLRDGEAQGRREGEERLRAAVRDVATLCGVTLDEGRLAWIASASLAELDAVRVALMRDRAWPK